jgi:Icc-related predicted phosphoesterase
MIITALCVSDTHGWLLRINEIGHLPDADIFIHAGDFGIWSQEPQEELFNELQFFEENQHRFAHMVIVPGNHDEFIRKQDPEIMNIINRIPNLHLLIDQRIVLDDLGGLRIYGSPWVTGYQDNSFGKSFLLPTHSPDLREKRELIPEDIDILITHNPPERTLDSVKGLNVGCALLRERLKTVHPLLHVFGHIHTANGAMFEGEENLRLSINAAICSMALVPFFEPFLVEILVEQNKSPRILNIKRVWKKNIEMDDNEKSPVD